MRLALAAPLLASSALAATQPERPNIIVILADDLGYGDVQDFNPQSKISTPNLDRLAREGLRFTDAHAPAAICTPTRYSLLTGRYPWRSRLKSGVLMPFDPPLIEAGRLTLPAMLRQQGYATAMVGKWHLGWDWPTLDGKPATVTLDGVSNVDCAKPIANGPLTRGFEYYFGVDAPDFPPYVFIENDRTLGVPTEFGVPTEISLPNDPVTNRRGPMLKGWEPVRILPTLAARAVHYVEAHSQDAQPFFLYLALTSPHYPVVPVPEFTGKSRAGRYGDFVAQTDAVVGAVMEAVHQTGADRNTLVIFTSDNGPEAYPPAVGFAAYDRIRQYQHASMAGWRGVKCDSLEGGHRVPFIAWWPSKVPAGQTNESLIGHLDLMATIAALTGCNLPAGAAPDSYNQLPALLENKPTHRNPLVYQAADGSLALRQGDWVFIDSNTCGGIAPEPEWFRQDRGLGKCAEPGALYNLRVDPTQARNLYEARPEKVRELKMRLEKIRQE